MAPKLWPFGKSAKPLITKETPEEIALTVALGANFTSSFAEDSQDNSLAYYADVVSQNAIAFACIRELATSVSAVTLLAVEEPSKGEYAEYTGPLADILQTPNPDQSQTDFIESMVEDFYIYGNVYVWMERVGRANTPVKNLFLLRPDFITINTGKGPKAVNGIESYTYSPTGEEGTSIPAADIAHLKYPNTTSGAKVGRLYGLSPMSVIKADVISDGLMSDLSKNFLQRGAVPAGLLKMARRVSSQADADEIRRRWASSFAGKKGQFSVAVLDADSNYEPLQALPKDLALEQTRDEIVSRICAVLGVPPIVIGSNLGLKRSTYSNYRSAMRSYTEETVSPLIHRIVRFMNLKITPLYSQSAYIKADYESAAAWQENEDVKSKRVISLYNSGITSLNEARRTMGYDSIDGGDIRRSPSNVFEVNVGDAQPQLNEPAAEKILQLGSVKDLIPSAEAQSPSVEIPPTGPRPVPNAQQLINSIRKEAQQEIDLLAKALNKKYFKVIQSRISGYVGRRLNESTVYSKQDGYPFTEDDLLPAGLKNDLATLLEITAAAVVAKTFSNIQQSGILPVVEVNTRNKYYQLAIQQAGQNATYIHQTTHKAIARTLAYGLENGLTVQQIAQGGVVDGKPYKGLKGVINSSSARVATIARTEIMQATNYASLSYYETAGFEKVQLLDGDQFDGRCIERNGKIVTIAQASTEEEHPNGILDMVPVIERDEDIDRLIGRLDQQIQQRKEGVTL